MITKAIIPVAGKGTRFLPITKAVSKEMLPVVDIPVLLLILKECADSGIKEVMLVTRKGKGDIKKFFTRDEKLNEELKKKGQFKLVEMLNEVLSKLKIRYKYQREDLIGTAGAIYVAKNFAQGEPFAVLYGDDINFTGEDRPALGQLIDCYNETGKMVLGCKWVDKEDINKYGAQIIEEKLGDKYYKVSGVIEKPKKGTEPSTLASLARYIMPANTFTYIEKQMEGERDTTKEICLTDTMDLIMKAEGGAIACVMNSVRYDTGDKFGYLTTVVEYALRDPALGKQFKEYLKNLDLNKF